MRDITLQPSQAPNLCREMVVYDNGRPAAEVSTRCCADKYARKWTQASVKMHLGLLAHVGKSMTMLKGLLHDKLSTLDTDGIKAEIQLENKGKLRGDRSDYERLFAGPMGETCEGTFKIACFSPSTHKYIRYCLTHEPKDPVSLRALRMHCDDVLGDQPDANAAVRQSRRLMLRVHPDKMQARQPEPRFVMMAREQTYNTICSLRALLNHPYYQVALYEPGRQQYGCVDWGHVARSAVIASAYAATIGFFFAAARAILGLYLCPGLSWVAAVGTLLCCCAALPPQQQAV